jgi:hypothetical protein
MDETVAIITGLFSLGGIIISSLITNSIVKYRVDQLEKKVDKHNAVIERVYKLEQKVEDIS